MTIRYFYCCIHACFSPTMPSSSLFPFLRQLEKRQDTGALGAKCSNT